MSAAKATGSAWKLPPEMVAVLVGEDDWIVGDGGSFDGQSARGVIEQVERCAHHLRLASEAVGILHLRTVGFVAGENAAAVEQGAEGGGDANLARLTAKLRHTRVERLGRTLERVGRQRTGRKRRREHPLAAEQGIEGDGGAGLRAVDQRQTLLRAELQRREAETRQRVGRAHHLPADIDRAIAHQRCRHVRKRREVARRADASLRRDQRHGVTIEQRLERVDDFAANAGVAAAEADQLENDHQPGDVARQRIAEAGAMRQDQVGLQLRQPMRGDSRVGEDAEACVDAIDGVAVRDDAVDGRARLRRCGSGRRRRGDAGAPDQSSRRMDERDALRVELHQRPTIGKSNPCSRAQSMAIS